MMITFYEGGPKPIKVIGRNQVRLAQFAEKYRCWHTHANDRATVKAVAGLVKRGAIVTRENNGFKWHC